jgi:glycosyltransferase involved in cell wall biosynthesis
MIDKSNLPTVDIIFPVRNRQWILPQFLTCILNLDYPKHLISIITYLNDSVDDSESILKEFKQNHQNEYKNISIYRYDLGTPEYNNAEGKRGSSNVTFKQMYGTKGVGKLQVSNSAYKVYKALAKLRNHLLAKTSSEYVFSVDTDIFFEKSVLMDLLFSDKDMTSALICNGYMECKENPYLYLNIMKRVNNDKLTHIKLEDCKGIIPVSNTGAISLMSNKLVKSGAKYYDLEVTKDGKSIHYGEDAGFCVSAQKLGFEIYCNTDVKCSHIMSKEYLDKYLNEGFRF